jgi:hypothetical protein
MNDCIAEGYQGGWGILCTVQYAIPSGLLAMAFLDILDEIPKGVDHSMPLNVVVAPLGHPASSYN